MRRKYFGMITEEEKISCQRVAETFAEFFEQNGDMTVVPAGKWGFVHLCYYDGDSFAGSHVYQDSHELFEVLWKCWMEHMLLSPVEGTPLAECDYEELYEMLKPEERQAFANKRVELWNRAFDSQPTG